MNELEPKKTFSLALYIVALTLEAGLLYCGFTVAFLEEVPPYIRFIAIGVILALAIMATWWAGKIYLLRKDEIRQHPILLLTTLPVRILMCALFAAVVVGILVLIGNG